jgi:small ubiquitin-related modifier
MSEGAASAPAEEVTMTVRVRDQTGEEMFFKVKKETKMSKIFNAYAERRGMSSNMLRFMLDGERITDDATPKMLEIEVSVPCA